jgi:signal transduction histidine kinase
LVAKNITALLNAKNQLQDKHDELALFVYKASHDLKSPVASMMSLMDLHNESKDENEKELYLKMISDCTFKLNTVISDLLILGKITNTELEYEIVEIKPLIDSILKSIEFMEGFKHIALNIHIDEDSKSIITEMGLLRTILLNLIDNAIKYRKKGSEPSLINIHISTKENGILFNIMDNGIGIAESQQPSIFKMFYRATSASRGSGLGLYIVKTGLLKLGGTISFESTFGIGTTFSIFIPSK